MAEFLQMLAENPIVSTLVAAVGPGLFLIWRSLVAAAVRKIDQTFHDPDVAHLTGEVQQREITARVAPKVPLLPRGVIESEVRKAQSERPKSG